MAAPTVTFTFTNATTADATEVNTNEATDIIGAMTDGTKDFTIGSLTANGAATFNGNVTLGNAAGDTITVTGTATVTPKITLTGGIASPLLMPDANIAKTSAPTADSIYPNSMVKAWAVLTLGAGSSVTVTEGFNVDTATYGSNNLTINFHTDLASADYAVFSTVESMTTNNSPQFLSPDTKATGSFVLDCYQHGSGSSISAIDYSSGDIIHIMVMGTQ